MGIYRDCFGRLCYKATNSEKAKFEVTKGDNRIIRHYPYQRTDAVYSDPDFLWIDLPKFDSFVQAIRYLKENLERLR